MRYRNIVTGAEINSKTAISAPGYQLVDENTAKVEPAAEAVEEVKEAPKRKRSAKK